MDNVKTIEKNALALPSQVQDIQKINNQEDLDRANNALAYIREIRKKIKEVFDPIVDKCYRAWKEATAQRKKVVDPVDTAERYVKTKIADYVTEQNRIRREAEEKARLAELEAEQKAEEVFQESARLEANGSEVEAERRFDEALKIKETAKTAAPVVPAAPKMTGGHTRQIWEFEILDVKKIPRKYLVVDLDLIRRVVRAEKDKTEIPGVRAYPKTIVVGGRS